jgi:hypothetical protein
MQAGRMLRKTEESLRTLRLKPRNKNMSEFPEIQPFGPRPAPHNGEPKNEAQAVTPPEPVIPTPTGTQQNRVNLSVVVTAVAVGFTLGYLACRYQELILRQSKIDEFIDYAQDWIREQGPKIADPIKQGLESTGSSVEQAIKKVSASKPLDSLHLFHRKKPRKFLGFEIF